MTNERAQVEPLTYRPALDGVRAVAVVGVIGVHTHPRLTPGGAVGVDVFFVLSGFLITTLLVQELDRVGTIAVGRFYVRRALRLLPALAVVLVAVTAWAVVVASPSTRHGALREVAAAATYTRNWTGPWATTPGPLLGHTWSLALEEQFYLVWPVILLLALRPRRGRSTDRIVMTVFVACFVAAVVLRAAGVQGWSVLLVQRPDALLLGATAALARRRWGASWAAPRSRRHGALAVAVATVALVVLMIVPVSSRPGGPGVSLAAVAALILVVGVVAQPDSSPARAYASRPMVAIGRISYGLYLWQQPVLRWVDDRLVGRNALMRLPIGISGALACAALSYRFVERPALRWKERLGRTGERLREASNTETLQVDKDAALARRRVTFRL